ncbi:MAG: glycoside hydrolase family 6 protein [Thermoleophilaceae bacterium]
MGLVVALALAVAAVLAATGSAGASQGGNPMAGAPWYVDSQTDAAKAEREARASGRGDAADKLAVIARTPQSTWFVAADSPDSSPYVSNFLARSAGAAIVPITLHGLPQQVCAGENAPGATTPAEYRAWIDAWARQIGARRFVVFLEPDALAASRCLPAGPRRERLDLMTYAARTLSGLAHTAVYEDVGAGDWRSVRDAVTLLKGAGVRYARGFTLNTTHYDWTSAEIAYGNRVARALGNKHFVVNTAFNGRGPKNGRAGHEWCNPSGRALGPLPTTRTRSRFADALFWLGNPGLSDGSCNGGPPVGTFWEQWALELVRNTKGAPDFPAYRHR